MSSFQETLQQANNLRQSGDIYRALRIYEDLTLQNPHQPELIFNTALCFTESDPHKSLKLYEQVLALNPNVNVVYGNIMTLAMRKGLANEVMAVLNKLIEKDKGNLEAIYHRAVLIGSNGDYEKALLDFYFVLENSNLGTDPNAFKQHQISNDIALSKTELRNQTLNITITDDLTKYYPGISFKEYQYELPIKLFGDENYYLEFGKMMGLTLQEAIKQQPDYLGWCILNLDNFCVSEEVISLMQLKSLNVNEFRRINTIKLKILMNDKIARETGEEYLNEDF